MHEEMMVGFRRRRTQGRSGWGTPRPSLVASDVVSSRLVVGPVAAATIIGGAFRLKAGRTQTLDANDVSGHLSTMSRDITECPRQDSNLRHRL
jgi:hypothetical protein